MSSDFKVTLLGTGHPEPLIERFGPSTLVEAGDQKLLFDCGRGTMEFNHIVLDFLRKSIK